MNANQSNQILDVLERLEKANTAGAAHIQGITQYDLEASAHNTLWTRSSAIELTILKLLGSTPAKQVQHEFTQITSYGEGFGSGFFGEGQLPPATQMANERRTTQIKLMGEHSSTYILASLEQTQQVLGTSGVANIDRKRLELNLLRKKNRNIYKADTTQDAGGVNGLRFRGLIQQIREGTDGTTGTSPYGTHVIDLAGAALTQSTIREKATQIITVFGEMNALIMAPFVRSDLEASLDGTYRTDLPLQAKPYLLGQSVAGMQTQGGMLRFLSDNILEPIWWGGTYRSAYIEGAPPTGPALSTAASVNTTPVSGTSKWKAADAGDVYYVLTQVKGELESPGTRIPATGYLTVTADDEVVIKVTATDPAVGSFKLYRGTDADSAITQAQFMTEVAHTTSGAEQTIYDLNEDIPGTSIAIGLEINTPSAKALTGSSVEQYPAIVNRSEDFLKQEDDEATNAVTWARLGPHMGLLNLPGFLAEIDKPMLYCAGSPQVRNPLHCIVFKNVGRA